ncbi:M56 family metallopeptidase [Paenibacillus sp.]|uniref:M56 family metallopeptidase n=1 Tax=Paenibacillus sp. TaxID=58172 RepID=UPI002D522E3E|nr:M56 family metallopeptidase [Paenibacillus sp.]HZG88445.1 M56 family metallopeptidase [Paenibacillus sp.]
MSWKRRSKILFLMTATLTAVILTEMALYVYPSLQGSASAGNLFQYCSSWLLSNGLSGLVPVMDALVVSTLVLACWRFMQQSYLSFLAHRRLAKAIHEERTASLNDSLFGGRREVLVVDHQEIIALTMGFLRPKIVLSTGLLQLLRDDELAAVVQHEIHHKQSRDPLKMAFMHGCAAALWYIPILRWSYDQYRTAREILADAYAVRASGSSIGLGSALLKLIRQNQIRTFSFTYASFAETSINARLQQLLDPKETLHFKLPIKRALISLHTVIFVSAMLLSGQF